MHDLDPAAPGEASCRHPRGPPRELPWRPASSTCTVAAHLALSFAGVDEWWEPFTLGVGPAGAYVAGLDVERRDALRVRCGELLPTAPFELTASAWSVTAAAPG